MEASHVATRAFLIDELRRDLVGPGAPDEELTDRPTARYIAGILYPPRTALAAEEDRDSGDAADAEDDIDPGTMMAAALNPSAIGLSFAASIGARVAVRVRVATYEECEATDGKRVVWKRHPQEYLVELPDGAGEGQEALATGLGLFYRIRELSGDHHVTVSLVNLHREQPKEDLWDRFCFFQPEIEVAAGAAGEAIFLDRSRLPVGQQDPELRLYAMLYRHVPEFAVGHGCAVTWEWKEGENATRLLTQIVPEVEVPLLSADTDVPPETLEMDQLGSAKDGVVMEQLLSPLPQTYRRWLEAQESSLEQLAAVHRGAAAASLELCRTVAGRMEAGVRAICGDPHALEAFRLANQAMSRQRQKADAARTPPEGRGAGDAGPRSAQAWRAFQLGFLLLTIPSIVDPGGDDRQIVDLLWFPTGGGKTEAYLGLTAFSIFLRRLRAADKKLAAGVTVLMRYTLRLLTIQQFQRAATLIMACEIIRRARPSDLGAIPISLGLWVGTAATPNSLRDAKGALAKLLDNETIFEGNPYQLLSCPWCGARLTPRNYKVEDRLVIRCSREGCDFQEGMPLWIVDEDVYAEQPSLLIGTVDKFARLPWIEEPSALFGRGRARRLPPELIIQDELHLISGPLGTMVGLYETAIDLLARQGDIGPKVIASTATIRGAPDQVRGLFNRPLMQFPPPALDARDTFFARAPDTALCPGRVFVGVHAPGRSVKTALLRVYALILQRIHEHRSEPQLRDPYWTLVGYFNSLRELGGARRLVDDDVRARIQGLASRLDGAVATRDVEVRELTSRAGSSEIPEILEQMAVPMEQDDALDVLLATNMISVGVDIDRLGLMVVNGQPKATAEYIQATSRIGRRYPGLVITLYNWTRPRDRSHYERFQTYHSALYRHVEASSVTPFSARARDRGLPGVVIAAIRHLIPELTPDDAAGLLDKHPEEVRKVIDWVLLRTQGVDPGEVRDVTAEVQAILERWRKLAQAEVLRYGRSPRNAMAAHLIEPREGSGEDFPGYFLLNSLRDVEPETELRLLREDA